MERERLVSLNKEQASQSKRFHNLMRGQVRVFEMLEGRTRDNDVKCFFASHLGQPVHIRN